jgi:two-component system, cell cycle sensor histidine kinase and response regulator CckA
VKPIGETPAAASVATRVSLTIAPMMLHSIDGTGCITEVSDLWLERLGYTWDEVIGRKSTEFLTDASARYANEVVLPAFFSTGSCEVEYEMRRKDGTVFPARLRGVAVRNERGAFVRSIAVVEDLTERRALEREMFEVQKLDSLGVMAGNIAHDFNNLLASVIGSAQIAARHAAHVAAAASALDNVLLASFRAADLCQQLLAYSGRGRFELAVVELDGLIAELASMLETAVGGRARVVLELARDRTTVEVDATQVRQVLMNLILNAADAMTAAPGTITLRTSRVELDRDTIAASLRPEAAPGSYVCVAVIDDGCGMPREVRERVFEPFFTTKASGRGLGLAATLGIVRGHRGTLTIDSEAGEGTAFAIYLPLSTKSAPAIEPAAAMHETALVVDDDELVRTTIARQLEELGCHAIAAGSGAEALEVLARAPIALCLVDVSMPDMPGPVLAARIAERWPAIDIVLMSGFDEVDVAAAPHVRFLRKPFAERELIAALGRKR